MIEDKNKKSKKKPASERHVDSWDESGEHGRWVRVHRTPRRSLFTPHRVAGGPSASDCLSTKRVTKGTYIRSGISFEVIDDYSVEGDSHRMLEGAWLGITEFVSTRNDGDEDARVKELADDQTEGEHIGTATSPGKASARVSWADMTSDDEELTNTVRRERVQDDRTLSHSGARREGRERQTTLVSLRGNCPSARDRNSRIACEGECLDRHVQTGGKTCGPRRMAQARYCKKCRAHAHPSRAGLSYSLCMVAERG